MSLIIKTARSVSDREKIYQFRYGIYHSELQKETVRIDHERRMIHDECDEAAVILYAELDGEVVGTVRTNFGALSPLPESVKEKFNLELLAKKVGEEQLSATSFFMVKPEHRKTEVGALLLSAIYEKGVAVGTQYDFCLCELALLKIYQKMGYRQYQSLITMANGEIRVPLVLCPNGYDYLSRAGSPFLFSQDEAKDDHGISSKILSEVYPDFQKNGHLTEDELMAFFRQKNSFFPCDPFFENFSPETLKDVLSRGTLLHLNEAELLDLRKENKMGGCLLLSGYLTWPEEQKVDVVAPLKIFPMKKTYSVLKSSFVILWNKKNWDFIHSLQVAEKQDFHFCPKAREANRVEYALQ